MPEPTEVIAAPAAPAAAAVEVSAAAVPATPPARYFLRFTLGQRYLHAVLFTTFLGLAATGLPLRFSGAPWAIRLAKIVDGFGTILFFHKFCALVLTLAFLVHVREIIARGFFRREKGIFWGSASMVANWKDVSDLFAHFRWFLGLGPKPKFERYAYWEKFDYWAVFWGMVVIGFSGYAMWFAPFFALPARMGPQCCSRHSQRGRPPRHPLHLLHSLCQYPPASRQLPHGHGDLHRPGERRGVQDSAAARVSTHAPRRKVCDKDHRRPT